MKRKFKRLIISVLLLCASLPLFAVEEYVSVVYQQIDQAFANRSDSHLDQILSKYQGDSYYFLMENYSIKKVRRLIIINDYEFAMAADLVIIDNNLDSIEAVELYTTIADAYELQKAIERENEEKRLAEERRIIILKENQKSSAEKQYNTVKTSSGNTVYSTGKDGGQFTYSGWNFDVGIQPGILTNSGDGLTSILVGLQMDYGYYRIVKGLNIGGDVGASVKFLNHPVAGADASLFFDANLMAKVAFRDFTDKFFVRAGLDIEGRVGGESKSRGVVYSQDLQNTFLSPAIGIKLQDVNLGSILWGVQVDWLASHLWMDNLDFAMKVGTDFHIPFANLDIVNLDFIIGVNDVLFLKKSGLENRLNFVIALGGRNVK